MAVEETTPHGLKKYTAGTDPIPGRAGHNLMVDKINQIPGLGIGPLSSRPAPSAGLRLWVEESTQRMSVNLGTEWAELASIGGVTPPTARPNNASLEGTSQRAARADHTHGVPLATRTKDGSMSAADKTLLDTATPAAEANQLIKRDKDGYANIQVPSAPNNDHIINYGHLQSRLSTPGTYLAPQTFGTSLTQNTEDPFGSTIKNNRVYLRGSMKCIKEDLTNNFALIPGRRPPKKLIVPIVAMLPNGGSKATSALIDTNGGCYPLDTTQQAIGTTYHFDNVWFWLP